MAWPATELDRGTANNWARECVWDAPDDIPVRNKDGGLSLCSHMAETLSSQRSLIFDTGFVQCMLAWFIEIRFQRSRSRTETRVFMHKVCVCITLWRRSGNTVFMVKVILLLVGWHTRFTKKKYNNLTQQKSTHTEHDRRSLSISMTYQFDGQSSSTSVTYAWTIYLREFHVHAQRRQHHSRNVLERQSGHIENGNFAVGDAVQIVAGQPNVGHHKEHFDCFVEVELLIWNCDEIKQRNRSNLKSKHTFSGDISARR